MDAVKLKSDLHSLIDKVNDISLLNAIKTILSKQAEKADFWEDLPAEVQGAVKRGIDQAGQGQMRSHNDVMQKHSKWL
jgi:predicted transcriptional regulator